MKEFFFLGDVRGNNGPANVNKEITKNLTDRFSYVHFGNKVRMYMEAFAYTLFCKVVIVSGMSKCGNYMIKIANVLNKGSIYIMHGCYEMESIINDCEIDIIEYKKEQQVLKNVDLILTVSERYGKVIKERYPQYKDKIEFLYNGVKKYEKSIEDSVDRERYIVAVGGNQILKNNYSLASAVEKVPENVTLTVFGNIIKSQELYKSNKIQYAGKKSQEELFEAMISSKLFVLNSICESFSLTVLEALFCGCSILVSNCAGVLDILEVTDSDIIYDPFDENEIAEKISYLLKHPNNERIMNSLDLDSLSYAKQVEKLEVFCKELLKNRQN